LFGWVIVVIRARSLLLPMGPFLLLSALST
jgi:hypothetical protein